MNKNEVVDADWLCVHNLLPHDVTITTKAKQAVSKLYVTICI